MARFNHLRPEGWTWATLNAWLMSDDATPAHIKRALVAESKFRRLAYQLRLQARLNRVQGILARRKLIGK